MPKPRRASRRTCPSRRYQLEPRRYCPRAGKLLLSLQSYRGRETDFSVFFLSPSLRCISHDRALQDPKMGRHSCKTKITDPTGRLETSSRGHNLYVELGYFRQGLNCDFRRTVGINYFGCSSDHCSPSCIASRSRFGS